MAARGEARATGGGALKKRWREHDMGEGLGEQRLWGRQKDSPAAVEDSGG